MAQVKLLLSGGMGSGVLLADLLKRGHEVSVVHHLAEGEAGEAQTQAAQAMVRHHDVEYSELADVIELAGPLGLDQPNMTVYLWHLVWAMLGAKEEGVIAAGCHGGMLGPVDQRPPYLHMLGRAVQELSEGRINLSFPYVNTTHAELISRGREQGAMLVTAMDCAKPAASDDGYLRCGRCRMCKLRREAYRAHNADDPAAYK